MNQIGQSISQEFDLIQISRAYYKSSLDYYGSHRSFY
jgi:hypothetical protein